jgi:site-specific DNA recombinase
MPRRQEQQRLERRLAAMRREDQRLIDAYQAGVIELDDLKERRERVTEECRRLEANVNSLRQRQQEQRKLSATVHDFLEKSCTVAESLPNIEQGSWGV